MKRLFLVSSKNLKIPQPSLHIQSYRYGSEEMKKKYLPGLHNGTSICALCVTDDMAGSDANSASASILQG